MVKVPRWLRSFAFVLAAAAFVVAAVMIIREDPERLRNATLWPLAIALALVPLAMSLNVIEYRLSARYLGIAVTWGKALQITVLGSAANMLPLPGAMVVRTAGLASHGATAASSAAVTLIFSGSWIAMSCLYSGAAVILAGHTEYGAIIVGMGVAALIGFFVLSAVKYKQSASLAAYALVTKLGVVVIEATQIYFCFLALNVDVDFVAASAIQISAIAGSAFAVVPAGLGIREGVGAVFAELLGLGRAVGFLAVALNRLMSMIVLIPLALVFSARSARQ